MDFNEELDLRDLIEYLISKIKWIIIVVLISVIIGNASTINKTKMYQSKWQFRHLHLMKNMQKL